MHTRLQFKNYNYSYNLKNYLLHSKFYTRANIFHHPIKKIKNYLIIYKIIIIIQD
jgi:hypothetical protein